MSTSTTTSKLFDGARRLSPDEMANRRDDLLEQLRDTLKTRLMSGADVAAELGVSRGTAHDYLYRLQSAGLAQRVGKRDEFRRDLWAATNSADQLVDALDHGVRGITIVPARQVGMFRHWLDVAFFGPAPLGAAA